MSCIEYDPVKQVWRLVTIKKRARGTVKVWTEHESEYAAKQRERLILKHTIKIIEEERCSKHAGPGG